MEFFLCLKMQASNDNLIINLLLYFLESYILVKGILDSLFRKMLKMRSKLTWLYMSPIMKDCDSFEVEENGI